MLPDIGRHLSPSGQSRSSCVAPCKGVPRRRAGRQGSGRPSARFSAACRLALPRARFLLRRR